MDIIGKIAEELGIREGQAKAAVQLIDEGCTIPFIARYRKEATGALSDEILRDLYDRLVYLRNLEDKKQTVLSSIEEREEALFETSMFTGILSCREKTPAQKAGEEALHAIVEGKTYDLSALQGEENESPYLAVVHGEDTHELLAAIQSSLAT